MLPRTYVRYSIDQILYLKQHYRSLSNAELAQALGIDSPQKVRELARRHGIKWRAENGAPQWRAPKTPNHQAHRWAA
jgi:hypothetical protein